MPVPTRDPAERFRRRLKEAAKAFENDTPMEAKRLLTMLVKRHPDSPEVRELHGLTLYQLGRWRQAIVELEAFEALTSSTEQHPVLADCYRALGDYRRVTELWEELCAESPAPELVAEGRIVTAGALADQGDLQGALRMLSTAVKPPKRVAPHHLRLWYALGDVRERAGDAPGAREMFQRVALHDAAFADVQQRLDDLD